MKIVCEWFQGERPQFNVSVSSGDGKQPFITIKGCRIVDGRDGRFVSWPATKNEKTQKYWQHVWASEPFAAAVLAEAEKGMQKQNRPAPSRNTDDADIPF